MLLTIGNAPRDYAWGRRGAISALLGLPDTDAVEAELWLGAHPGSPSRVLEPEAVGGAEDLALAVEAVPELTGGTGRFPFLLKVLAAGAPLSLQAHPTAAQAREGFERENAAGIPVDAPNRNYRDPYPKPEVIVAVSERFEALSGFRPAAEASREIVEIAAPIGAQDAVLPLLRRLADDESVGDAFVWLLSGAPEVPAIVEAIGRGVAADPLRHPHAAWIAGLYPGDPGIVGALLLHHVALARGEALYLPAGNVHAYLDGVGIELMVASDNVLRGGLTPKHVDAAELARVLHRAAGPVPLLEPRPLPEGGVEYRPEDPEAGFGLALVETAALLPLSGPAIALCIEGAFALSGAASTGGIARGEAMLITPDEGELRVSGAGRLFVAR